MVSHSASNLNAISRMSPPLFVGQQMEVCINAVEHGSELRREPPTPSHSAEGAAVRCEPKG